MSDNDSDVISELMEINNKLHEKIEALQKGTNICWKGDMDATVAQNMELKAKMKKMECCGNCKHLHHTVEPTEGITTEYVCKKGGYSMGHCKEWEFYN